MPALLGELGKTNPQRTASVLFDDFLTQLRGTRAIKVYEEMASNDATIASILHAVKMLARSVTWEVDGDDEASAFLNDNLEGMAHPWEDFIGQCFDAALPYGFSYHEIVYRRDEGRIMWDKFSHRPAKSLLRWELDDKNVPVAFVQTLDRGQAVAIPVEKAVYWRTDTTKPEGTSALRGAYRAWYFKKKAEEDMMVGVNRNLTGYPILLIPSEVLALGEGNAVYDSYQKFVTRVKRDEQMGGLLPSDRDENGNLLYEFELVSPRFAGRGFEGVIGIVRMLAMDIASTLLAQFVGLGRDAVGSRALAEPQQELFQTTLETYLDQLEETINRQAVRMLFAVNQWEPDTLPRIKHGEVRDVDLEGLANFILKIGQAGVDWQFDEDNINELLGMAGLDSPVTVGNVSADSALNTGLANGGNS